MAEVKGVRSTGIRGPVEEDQWEDWGKVEGVRRPGLRRIQP